MGLFGVRSEPMTPYIGACTHMVAVAVSQISQVICGFHSDERPVTVAYPDKLGYRASRVVVDAHPNDPCIVMMMNNDHRTSSVTQC